MSFTKYLKRVAFKSKEDEIKIPKEKHISPEKRQQITDELRLV